MNTKITQIHHFNRDGGTSGRVGRTAGVAATLGDAAKDMEAAAAKRDERDAATADASTRPTTSNGAELQVRERC